MEMKEMEIEMVKIPEDSLVAVSFPNLDLHDVKIVMKQLIKAGEDKNITFIYLPESKMTVMKKEVT